METLIRLSSTLSTQIKELGVKVTARDVRTKGVNGTGRVDPALSFSACVLNVAVAGEVFFEPNDSLHGFIQQIEDTIIHSLLEKISITELPSVSGFFVSEAARFHTADLTACIYSTSPLATIRSSIRLIASHDIGHMKEHLESIFLGISSFIEKKMILLPESSLRGLNFSSSVNELSRKQLSFAPLDNDPFAEVLHCRLSPSSLGCPPPSKGSAISKPRSTVLAIRVENAGSEQVHGLYSLSTTLSKANSLGVIIQNPVYQNSDGYLISCHQKEVCLSIVNSSSHFDAVENGDESSGSLVMPSDSPSNGCNSEPGSSSSSSSSGSSGSSSSSSSNTLYRWVISNPSLDCKYYTCSTMEPSPLPPAMGWKSYGPSCQGKLPGPHLVLTIVDDESPGDSDSGASEPEDVDSRPEAADTMNSAALPGKGMSTKSKKKKKSSRKDATTALVSNSFSPCIAKLLSSRRNSVESDSSSAVAVQDSKHRRANRKVIEKRLCVPDDGPVECDVAFPCCAVNEKASIQSIQSIQKEDSATSKDPHLSAFSEALEMIKSSHCDRADSSRTVLQMRMKQLHAAEMLQSSRVREICERQAWLTEVTDTDELLKGFPSHMDVVNDDDHAMEAFSAEWDLKSAVSRVNAACLMTKSNCLPVSKESSPDLVLEATVAATVVPVTANMKPALAVTCAPVMADVHITEPAGVVRKVTSLPSFKEEDRSHDKGHRRSQSQTQTQSHSHSIFQWPEDAMPSPSVNFSTDNDQYRQLPSWTDGSLVTNSLKRSTSQLQWPPAITESSPTNIGDALSTSESSEIPVPINNLASNKLKSDHRSEADGEWDGDGEGSASCFESLLNAMSPAEQQCLSYSIVNVIGIQMRVPQSSSNGNGSAGAVGASLATNGAVAGAASEKAHYVIRISLRDSGLPRTVRAVQTAIRTHNNSGSISGSRIRIPLSPPSITIERESPGGSTEGNVCNDGVTDEPSDPTNGSKSVQPSLSISKDSIADQQAQSSPRRHSMAGLRPTYLFSRQVCTIRKDLTSLFLFHAQLSDLLLAFKDNTIVPPPFPDPFLIANFEEGLVVCSAQQVGSFSRQMRPQKKADLFAYSSSMKSQNLRVKEAMDCPGLDRTLHDIQQYLRSIFLLVENIDNRAFSTEDDQNLPRDRCADSSDDRDLVASLGKLIGSLLTSPDHEEKNQIRPTHAVSADLLPSSTTAPTSAPLRMARKPSDAPAPAPSTQEKVSFRSRYKACWRPYLTSGLKMRLSLCDDQGGRLSMKSDEELLRAQGGKCVGCGEPISAQWGFLGLDRNYQPCRLYGGLFCRKWCHGNDRRQIPHRLLLHWDHRAHRVSKQAARFLDMLWSQPVLMISSANPLLYEGVPALRLTRNMRGRVVQLIKRVLKSDTCPEKSDVRDVIMAVLGAEQAHLCLSKELYSIADLVGVQNGDLLASLEALIGMLRDMDRTLGVA